MGNDYRQKTEEITRHQRACRIVIENPFGGTPTATFVEEEVARLPDGNVTHRLVGSLKVTFDPDELVAMIDPATNAETETIHPVSLAQWIIYSMYWKKAQERDNPVQPEALAGSVMLPPEPPSEEPVKEEI